MTREEILGMVAQRCPASCAHEEASVRRLLDVAQRLQRAWPDDMPRCDIETAVDA